MTLSLFAAIAHGDNTVAARPAAPPSALEQSIAQRTYDRCVDEMVKNVCSAMNDRSAKATPAPGTQVFVAGVGAIDAASYQRIRESGKGMCQQVRRSCEADFHGAQCKTAVSLWGAPS